MHKGKYSTKAIRLANESLVSDIDLENNLPWVPSFEERFAKFSDFKYAIALNSGTSGLHASLLALGVGPGDEVISPALTVIMDAFATIYTGAIPIFADVDKETWNIDPEIVESLITPKTKAIISVSWFGLPANLVKLREICNKYNLLLLDDSAETISLKPLEPKSIFKPDIRVFSFESKKHMSTGGEGGIVVTDDELLAKKIRQYSGLGYKHLTADRGRTSLAAKIFQNPNYERFDAIGFNYRMTPVTAAIGIGQLDNIDLLLDSRIKAATKLIKAIHNCDWLIPQPDNQDGINHTYYTFGVRYLGNVKWNIPWEDFYEKFTSAGGHGFYANCKNPYLEPFFYGKNIGQQRLINGLCPVSEELQKEIMAFKTNYLDDKIIETQAEILSDLIDKIGR